MSRFHAAAAAIEPELVRVRRDIHAHPEIGFCEERTAALVADALRALGLVPRTGVGKTGVVADLEGALPGPRLLLRFDMDALPILEGTGLPFSSREAGVMHACGHDGHVAIGLAVARLLVAERERLSGAVRFVFQPAEELVSGARAMVADGALEPRPDVGLALHLWNERPFGWIGATDGPAMAAADAFTLDVHGHGGHGATPHNARDPIVAAAHIITAAQSIVARNVPPLESGVVSFGSVAGGEAFNVIPPAVKLKGTLRAFTPDVHETLRSRLDGIASGIPRALGCEGKLAFEVSTKAVVNDRDLALRVRELASRVPGVATVSADERTMGSEDAPYLLASGPYCFFFVGCGFPERPETKGHHHSRFDWDERALVVATALMADAAWDALTRPRGG